jgi:hypothetical protein
VQEQRPSVDEQPKPNLPENQDAGGLAGAHSTALGVPEIQVRNQERDAGITQMGSQLHTLLAGFPPGEQRVRALALFPEIDTGFSVRRPVSMPETSVDTQEVVLPQLLSRAVQAIGGIEHAETILEYPGLTLGPGFNLVRKAPDDWQEVSNRANRLGPQFSTVLNVKLGRRIFEAIMNGEATWDDVAYGYLDRSQIAKQKAVVAGVHTSLRSEPTIPTGHVDPALHPNVLSVIPDARLGQLWRIGPRGFASRIQYVTSWVEKATGIQLPPPVTSLDAPETAALNPVVLNRVKALFGDDEFGPFVKGIYGLYVAADEALESPHGRFLLAERLKALNTVRSPKLKLGLEEATRQFNVLVRDAVVKRAVEVAQETGVHIPPEEVARLFG